MAYSGKISRRGALIPGNSVKHPGQKRASVPNVVQLEGDLAATRARKSLGQNFLIDGNIARKIVHALSILGDEPVLEIGPGRGALTRLLLKKCSHLTAIEKDRRLFDALRQEFETVKGFDLVNGDFLDYDFARSSGLTKVVGNIPYNMTSQIVSRLVDVRSRIDFAVLMVQKEVADRLAAVPGTKSYGAISVRLQLVARVLKLFGVAPTCFRPQPKVDSSVIRISFFRRRELEKENEFVRFVKKSFGMRRKMIRHFVAHYYGRPALGKIEEILQFKRIEALQPEEIYRMFLLLEDPVGAE
jgi:16S rRNA (adenine1518-N6/adenine1519-N6)-dimethyltransferase